ncbi:GNAT family N-acetyltransferase [Rossellomorea vietnamensis]|uniref:GNAT family N-acetyltransferase n=1 Tax=Rossellomorea vietnamensis TaxID=218284 RepID=UPI001CCF1A87|nr:GNAT family N-acetyltransferase [Rossellomorea vietnamensis]MCA0149859.1 GNAT family N-acetyltransferase [Rossellomorea vietnamensis]
MPITLALYNETHEHQLKDFHLPEEQLQFTSLPLDKIHNPTISPDTRHIVILRDDVPVGYFALENGDKLRKYSTNPKARLLTSFSIDARHQGQGIAKEGLNQLPNFIREHLPDTDEVVLGVNKRNQAAISLYLKTGFTDDDEVYVGPKGPQHVLHLKI